MYYQDNNTEHHKVNYPPYEQTLPDSWEKTGNKIKRKTASPHNYYLQQLPPKKLC